MVSDCHRLSVQALTNSRNLDNAQCVLNSTVKLGSYLEHHDLTGNISWLRDLLLAPAPLDVSLTQHLCKQ